MKTTQSLDLFRIDGESSFAKKHVGEQAAAHPDFAMDSPHGDVNPFRRERLAPSQYVLIDAIDQRAVEIERKGGFRNGFVHRILY
jgi:hypothetical protein